MSGAAWTALGSVIVALITGLVALLTHRVSTRATAKASVVDGYASLTDQLQEERAAMQATITALREATAAAQATANAALEAANRARVLVGDLVAEVETIVTWIDQGATPPPPPVSPRLRTLLAQHGTRRPKET